MVKEYWAGRRDCVGETCLLHFNGHESVLLRPICTNVGFMSVAGSVVSAVLCDNERFGDEGGSGLLPENLSLS